MVNNVETRDRIGVKLDKDDITHSILGHTFTVSGTSILILNNKSFTSLKF